MDAFRTHSLRFKLYQYIRLMQCVNIFTTPANNECSEQMHSIYTSNSLVAGRCGHNSVGASARSVYVFVPILSRPIQTHDHASLFIQAVVARFVFDLCSERALFTQQCNVRLIFKG